MKHLLYILAFALLTISCTEEAHVRYDKKLTANKNDHPIVYTYDSLMLNLQLEKASDFLVEKLANTHTPSSIDTFIHSKLWRHKLHDAWMYEVDHFPELDSTKILSIDSFYYELYTTGEFQNLEFLLSNVEKASTDKERIEYLYQLARYYMHADNNYDTAFKYATEAEELLYKYDYNSNLHLDVYYALMDLNSYDRTNLKGLVLCEKLLDENRNHLALTDKVKARIYNQYSLIQLRREEIKSALMYGEKFLNLLSSNKCIPEYQNGYKNLSYTNLYSGRPIDSLKLLLKQYQKNIEQCGSDFVNFNRVKGQVLYVHEKYGEAIFSLKNAIIHAVKQKVNNRAIDNSLRSILVNSYSNIKEFIEARNLIESSIDTFKSAYSFIDYSTLAHLDYNQWVVTKNKTYLYACLNNVNRGISLLHDQLNTINEEAFLRLSRNKVNLATTGMRAAYDLYKLSPNNVSINDFFLIASIKKSYLLERDRKLNTLDSLIPAQIINDIHIIKTEIKELSISDHWMDIESVLKREKLVQHQLNNIHKNTSFTQGDLLERRSLKDIQNIMNVDQTILDYYIVDNYLYLLLINKDEAFVNRVSLNSEKIRLINTFYDKFSNYEDLSTIENRTLSNNIYKFLQLEYFNQHLKENIIIVADDILHKLSFAALETDLTSKLNSKLNHNHSISYTHSLQLWENKQFEVNNSNLKVAVFSYSDPISILKTNDLSLPELSNSYLEAKSIAKQYPNTKIFSGNSATKENFINTIKSDYDMIFLSTHGQANGSKRDDVKLYFRTENFGIDSIYGFNIPKPHNNIKLISLIACESGYGFIQNSEGLFSINRYFNVNTISGFVRLRSLHNKQHNSIYLKHSVI